MKWWMVANETETDYLGGFLAYTAGYGMFENLIPSFKICTMLINSMRKNAGIP